MAADRYLFCCECGYEIAVRSAAAGTRWRCPNCKQETGLPSLRELRRRIIVAEPVEPAPLLGFFLASIAFLTVTACGYVLCTAYLGLWLGTIVFGFAIAYVAFQGLLLFRGTSLVVYGNSLAFIAIVLLSPMPAWLLNQREQTRRFCATEKLGRVSQRYSEEIMYHGKPREGIKTFR